MLQEQARDELDRIATCFDLTFDSGDAGGADDIRELIYFFRVLEPGSYLSRLGQGCFKNVPQTLQSNFNCILVTFYLD